MIKYNMESNRTIIHFQLLLLIYDVHVINKRLLSFLFNLKSFKVVPVVSKKQEISLITIDEIIELVTLIFPYMKDIFKVICLII